MSHLARLFASFALAALCAVAPAAAQGVEVVGTVRDQTGDALPGVVVELTAGCGAAATGPDGRARRLPRSTALPAGRAAVSVRADQLRGVAARHRRAGDRRRARVDAMLHLALSADVTVTGKSTFTNLADVERPGREPGRHRAVGQPGRDHRAAARRAADHARGRGARDRARRRHQPAQRRGQGQSVLPARLQPRSRHRLRDDGRRHAGQHADARARARLLRSELPDPRAGQRRAVLEGPVLRRPGRLRDRRRGQHQLRQRARPADRARRRRRPGLRPRAGGGVAERRAAARCSAALEVAAQRRSVGRARRLPEGQRRGALQPGRRAQRLLGHRHGLPRHVGLDRPGPAARRRRRPASAASARSIRPTAATPIATAARSSGSGRAATPATKVSAYGIGYDLNLFSNFTYFLDDPEQRRPVPAGRSPLRAGRARSRIGGSAQWGGRADAERRRRRSCGTTTSATSASITRWRAQPLETVREDGVRQTSVGGYAQNEIAVDAVAADAGRPARRRLPLRRRRRRSGELAAPTTPASSARRAASIFGPWRGTELYVNAGLGFHSNDARGATITRRSRRPASRRDRVTPLVRARGAEVGVRTRRASRTCRPRSRSGRWTSTPS